MNYQIHIKRSAQKSLAKIPGNYRKNITDAIRKLSNNPKPHGCKKLAGRDAWRIRIGDYRVIYEVKDHQLHILIVNIGHRKAIYR